MTENDEVIELLKKLSAKQGKTPKESLRIFEILIRVKLEYRGQLKKQSTVLTVQDTNRCGGYSFSCG